MAQMQTFRKTRIAPTPSGYLHLGNAMSFMITAALARMHHATILLRLDDLDSPRIRPEYIADVFETLNFLGIPWDEGPRNLDEAGTKFSQRLKIPRYHHAIDRLQEKLLLFRCVCSRKDLLCAGIKSGCTGRCKLTTHFNPAREFALRLYTDEKEEVFINTYPAHQEKVYLPSSMKEFVIQKKDRMPAYQLVSLVDDLDHGIDFIIRGQDLWDSTISQAYLASLVPEFGGFLHTTFFHHSLMTKSGQKLSKSAGDTSIQQLRKQGITRNHIYQLVGGFLGFDHQINNLDDLSTLFAKNPRNYLTMYK